MGGMAHCILDNAVRTIDAEVAVNLLGDLFSRQTFGPVLDHPIRQDAGIHDDPVAGDLPGIRSTSGHSVQSMLISSLMVASIGGIVAHIR